MNNDVQLAVLTQRQDHLEAEVTDLDNLLRNGRGAVVRICLLEEAVKELTMTNEQYRKQKWGVLTAILASMSAAALSLVQSL